MKFEEDQVRLVASKMQLKKMFEKRGQIKLEVKRQLCRRKKLEGGKEEETKSKIL